MSGVFRNRVWWQNVCVVSVITFTLTIFEMKKPASPRAMQSAGVDARWPVECLALFHERCGFPCYNLQLMPQALSFSFHPFNSFAALRKFLKEQG